MGDAAPAFLGIPAPVLLAHRGGAQSPPSTAVAFAAAVAVGCPVLETDVRATADGVLLCFHDADLAPSTTGRGPLASARWADLAGVEVLSPDGSGPGAPLLALADALDAWPGARFNLDVKSAGAVTPLVALLAGRPDRARRVCVASFSDARRRAVVRALAGLGQRVTSSAGRGGVLRFWLGAHLGVRGRALRRLVGADVLQVPERAGPLRLVTARLVAAAASAGLGVHVWTVDDPADARRLLDLGVTGLVTDAPLALREVLRERGSWPAAADDAEGAS